MNDQEAVYIYATIGDQDIKHELMQAGFTLSLDPREDDATSFVITVKGQPPGRFGKKEDSRLNSGFGQAGSVPPNRQDGPGQDMKKGLIKLPETLVVTYPYSPGLMTMTLSEARDNGIMISFEAVFLLRATIWRVSLLWVAAFLAAELKSTEKIIRLWTPA